jgi:hypothetical protein
VGVAEALAPRLVVRLLARSVVAVGMLRTCTDCTVYSHMPPHMRGAYMVHSAHIVTQTNIHVAVRASVL